MDFVAQRSMISMLQAKHLILPVFGWLLCGLFIPQLLGVESPVFLIPVRQ